MSSRSSVVVDGRTTSACRAVDVQNGSCTTNVSRRPIARRSRLRSWWWWNGLPPDPVGQPHVRVGAALAVVVVGLAGVQQHVRDPGDRDVAGHRVRRAPQGRHRDGVARAPVVAERPETVDEPAARQPDLAEHRSQRRPAPDRLLAVLGALQRLRARHQGPPVAEPRGQLPDRDGVDAGDRSGPVGGLVGEVGLEGLPAHAVRRQELPVVTSRGDHLVHQGQHQRDVGARRQRQPLRVDVVGEIRAQGADQHEPGAAGTGRAHRAAFDVPADAAGADRRVLQRHAAEREHRVRVRGHLVPADRVAGDGVEPAQDPREDHLGGAAGVGVDRARVAAGHGQESVQLALGVVEPAGARPAVAPAVDRRVAVLGAHAGQLTGQPVQHLVPADLDVGVGAAAVVRAGTVLPPGAADRGRGHPGRVVEGVRDVVQHRRRVGVVAVRVDPPPPVLATGGEHTPVRAVRQLGHAVHANRSRAPRRHRSSRVGTQT